MLRGGKNFGMIEKTTKEVEALRKRLIPVLCLILAVSLALSGCGMLDYLGRLGTALRSVGGTDYSKMEYARPDMTALAQTVENSCQVGRTSGNINEVLDAIYAYYDCYDDFYTNMSLAYIHYSTDLRDTYWEGEYAYCAENSAKVDAGLEELYYALAESPIRDTLEKDQYFGEGYFDAYEGESVWDDGLLSLMEQEAQLEGRYYELMGQQEWADYSEAFFAEYYDPLAQLLVELVAKRQEIAAYMGYDSFTDFAYDFYHYRDYTPDQAMELTGAIGQELGEIYRWVNAGDFWEEEACTQSEMKGYVAQCAEAMGGYVEEAYALMSEKGLWEIEPGAYKLDASFEVYLAGYRVPFVFVNPSGTQYDKLVLAHEFGHFAHDFVCGGSYAGTDVAEVLSQGMEYLSLFYCEDSEALTRLKAVDSLCIYVEQAAYASFEHRLYGLSGEDLTAENVHALYEEVGAEFGFDSWEWDSRDFVLVNHYFTEPMYLISYVVSNDAAFQLYQLEQEEAGRGLEIYEQMLYSQEVWFDAFVEEMGLESTFSEGRISRVRETMEQMLNYQ